jgi:hypothetical protein
MDKIIKITLGAFTVILIGFLAITAVNVYFESAYVASLSGNYTYSATITTDSPLSNVTLFIPVPEDRSGNSPVVAALSGGTVSGIPDGWKLTLFDTGKTTVVKITASSIDPPTGTTREKPFSITMFANISSKNHIETINPVENGVIFRPVQNMKEASCASDSTRLANSQQCYEYETSVYADYLSSPNASVSISSNLAGKNSWKIFEPRSNEYRVVMTVTIPGENHGWATAKGVLMTGIGMHDEPVIPS